MALTKLGLLSLVHDIPCSMAHLAQSKLVHKLVKVRLLLIRDAHAAFDRWFWLSRVLLW